MIRITETLRETRVLLFELKRYLDEFIRWRSAAQTGAEENKKRLCFSLVSVT